MNLNIVLLYLTFSGYDIFNNNGDNDFTDISPITNYVTNFAGESSSGNTSQPLDDNQKTDFLDISGITTSEHSLSNDTNNLSSSQNLGEVIKTLNIFVFFLTVSKL